MNAPASGLAQIPLIPCCKEATLTVSVVICTRNRPGMLRECLRGVARQDSDPIRFWLSTTPRATRKPRGNSRQFGARYTIEPIQGLSRARNRGLAECDTDIVAFLDDDAIPAPDWLGLLMEPFADEKTGASTGKVITPESINKDQQRRESSQP